MSCAAAAAVLTRFFGTDQLAFTMTESIGRRAIAHYLQRYQP